MNIEFRLDAKGIGDAVCGIYTACGLADRGHIVTFHAKHTEWLQWVDHPNLIIVPERDPKVFNANEGYLEQLEASRTGTCESRSLWYMQNIHGLHPVIKGKPQPARPYKLKPAGAKSPELPEKYIVLAPFSAYEDRMWNLQHWRMLAKVLINDGYNVIAIGSSSHGDVLREAFTKTGVRYFWGQSAEWTVNTIRHAQLLIGNDSGPAHIAGLYDAKAIALCGQIDGRFVYREAPSVTPIQPPQHVPCSPCHWKTEGGYTNLCTKTCTALQLISPFEVAAVALKEIHESKQCEAGGRKVDLSGTAVPWIQPAGLRPQGQPKEEDGAGQEGGRGEASPVRPEGLRGLHTTQGPEAPGELSQAISGNQRQGRKTNKGRQVQP